MENITKEKCFVIMPISDQGDYPADHFTKVYKQIFKPAIEEAGYEAYRVDENKICDSIIDKIFEAIQNCPMAICDLSNKNPNVLYELGLRQAYDKPVVLVQDEKTDKIFDVSGINTVYYSSERRYEEVHEDRKKIKDALLATKDGKSQSMAKIMKAKVADFSDISVSSDDKIQVVLSQIFSKIEEVSKKQKSINVYEKSHRNTIHDYILDFNIVRRKFNELKEQEDSVNVLKKKQDLLFDLQGIYNDVRFEREVSEIAKEGLLEKIVTLIKEIEESNDKKDNF